jgi:hypothetical protein
MEDAAIEWGALGEADECRLTQVHSRTGGARLVASVATREATAAAELLPSAIHSDYCSI